MRYILTNVGGILAEKLLEIYDLTEFDPKFVDPPGVPFDKWKRRVSIKVSTPVDIEKISTKVGTPLIFYGKMDERVPVPHLYIPEDHGGVFVIYDDYIE